MKNFIKNKHLFTAVLFLLLFVLSCNKNTLLETNPLEKQKTEKLVNNRFIEQKQKLYPADKEGNILNEKQIKELKSKNSTMALCDGYIIDGGSYYATLKYTIFNTDVSMTTTSILVEYEISVPGNINATGNVGTLLIPAAPPAIPSTLKYTTSTVYTELLETFYDPTYETDMNKYRVYFSVAVPYTSLCSYYNYRCNIKIKTDCEAVESFTTATTTNIGIQNDHYKKQYVYAYSPASGQLRFQQLNIMSYDIYCYDYLPVATSPKYLVQYKLTSSSTWIDFSAPFLEGGDLTISALPSGTYEWRYKYLARSSPDLYYPFYLYGTTTATVY